MLSTAVLLAVLPPVIFISRYVRALGPFDLLPGKRWTLPKLSTLLPRIPAWHLSRWSNSPSMALFWKATREMGLVGLLVFLVSLLLSMVAAAIGLVDGGPTTPFFAATSQSLRPFLWFGGFVLSILIGVGAAIGDVQAGVNTFWRSRPISPSAWYWSKYVVGLLTILVAVEMPAFVCIGYRNPLREELAGWFFWMLIWNATFSLALTATCLVRQPLQAAILAIGASGLLFAAVQAIFASGSEEPGPLALSAFVIAFATAWIVSTILGAWAAERDLAIS
jgi:hypothetical protein